MENDIKYATLATNHTPIRIFYSSSSKTTKLY